MMQLKDLSRNRKGFAVLQTIPMAVVILIVIGLMLVIGLKIESGVQETIGDDTTITEHLTNITMDSPLDERGECYPRGYQTARDCSLTITSAWNSSGTPDGYQEESSVPSTNYTISACSLTVVDGSDHANGTTINITGTIKYSSDTPEYNASGQAMQGLETMAGYQDLIGLIVIMVVIIGLVIGGFAYFFRGSGR